MEAFRVQISQTLYWVVAAVVVLTPSIWVGVRTHLYCTRVRGWDSDCAVGFVGLIPAVFLIIAVAVLTGHLTTPIGSNQATIHWAESPDPTTGKYDDRVIWDFGPTAGMFVLQNDWRLKDASLCDYSLQTAGCNSPGGDLTINYSGSPKRLISSIRSAWPDNLPVNSYLEHLVWSRCRDLPEPKDTWRKENRVAYRRAVLRASKGLPEGVKVTNVNFGIVTNTVEPMPTSP